MRTNSYRPTERGICHTCGRPFMGYRSSRYCTAQCADDMKRRVAEKKAETHHA